MALKLALLPMAFAFLIAGPGLAQKKVKLPKPGKSAEIIFVGNSLTHFHDLPACIRALGAADKPARRLTTLMIAPGGYTLQRHIESTKKPRPDRVIKKERADYVVLQEQSTRPLSDPKAMEKFATKLAETCKKSRSVPVWYMTYSKQHQPEFQDAISEQYQRVHQQNGGLLAPVGRAWQRVRRNNKDLKLHVKDGLHPNPHGAYLSACVLYGTMFGGDLRNLPSKLIAESKSGKKTVLIDIPEEEGQLLRDAAAEAVAAQYPDRQTATSTTRRK